MISKGVRGGKKQRNRKRLSRCCIAATIEHLDWIRVDQRNTPIDRGNGPTHPFPRALLSLDIDIDATSAAFANILMRVHLKGLTTNYTIAAPNVVQGTKYYFRVRANNSAGFSPFSTRPRHFPHPSFFDFWLFFSGGTDWLRKQGRRITNGNHLYRKLASKSWNKESFARKSSKGDHTGSMSFGSSMTQNWIQNNEIVLNPSLESNSKCLPQQVEHKKRIRFLI